MSDFDEHTRMPADEILDRCYHDSQTGAGENLWRCDLELDASRRVTRHAVDQVGNNLTAQLLWCAKHVEPVWVYNDGSFECPHTTVVGWDSDGEHDIVAPPWENSHVPTGTGWPT
jgi:hypothetical protein